MTEPAGGPARPLDAKHSILQSVLPPLVPTLLLAAYIGYNEFLKPSPQPVDQPLVVAAKTYIKTIPDAYESAAQQIEGGVLADKTAVVGVLQAHAKPLADALNAAFTPLIDEHGKILNAPAAANVLAQVATALKGAK